MRNLGGCGALLLYGGFLLAALVYWSNVAPGLDPAVADSLGRALFLIGSVGFFVTALIIIGAPMKRGK